MDHSAVISGLCKDIPQTTPTNRPNRNEVCSFFVTIVEGYKNRVTILEGYRERYRIFTSHIYKKKFLV